MYHVHTVAPIGIVADWNSKFNTPTQSEQYAYQTDTPPQVVHKQGLNAHTYAVFCKPSNTPTGQHSRVYMNRCKQSMAPT